MKKRFYAGLLTFVMIVNLMSAAVFAEDSTPVCLAECVADEHAEGCPVFASAEEARLAEEAKLAKAGDTISLIRNVEASNIITIDKAITLDGNGKTLTSKAGRAINVDTTGEVTIKNLEIIGGTGCERGINIINKAGTTNIQNVKISGESHYAVHVATSAGAANVNITDADLTGYGAVAIYGEGTKVNVTNSDLTGINTYTGDSNAFFTVAIGAKNTAVNVTGGKITAKSNEGYEAEYIFGHNADTSTGSKVNLDTELVLEGTNTHYLMVVYS